MLPSPWLCTIIKRDDFDGYGFSMYKKKKIIGHFIGSIGPGSPAEDAGLMEGDELVKVNGIDVTQENHTQVVQKIIETPKEVTILVVNNNSEKYHKEEFILKGLSFVTLND